MNKEIEIPEGYEARVEGNKVIFELKESEDERIRKNILAYFEGMRDKNLPSGMKQPVLDAWIAYLEKQKDKVVKFDHDREQKPVKVYDNMDDLIADAMIDEISKSDLLDSAKHNRIYWINKHRQKPAEWSEEDENMLNSIIATCQLAAQDRDSGPARHLLEMQERFLKSLRPQSHWKPREEQIEALKLIVSNKKHYAPVLHEIALDTLYNDLKKL